MIEEIRTSEVNSNNLNLLSSQALLAIRLCGTVLDQECQKERSTLVSSIWNMVLEKSLPLTVVHYNALLRVHLENRCRFDPAVILADMKEHSVEPDRETYQCFISSYCQEGNIDGASKILQTMKQKGFKVNENIFNSLIIGHSENGDLARSQGILKVMKQCGLSPSTETYLTLACAYAKHGDISAMDRIITESCSSQELGFKDGDFLELLFVLSDSGHKDQVGRILTDLHPETEEFGCLASHMVVRLVNAGHDDVAYNLVQFTVENSVEGSGKIVAAEFLEQLVKVKTTVSKLLWFLKDMSDRKIHTGGLENLVDIGMKNKDIALAVRLADILVSEGGRITKKQYKNLLALIKKCGDKEVYEHVFAAVKVGTVSKLMSPDILKKWIFPLLDTWPELTIAQLEDYGLSRDQTVTPMIEYLVGRGESESAATVAGIFSEHVDAKLKFLTNMPGCDSGAKEKDVAAEATGTRSSDGKSAVAADHTVACMAEQLLADDRIGDLELMLETREAAQDREIIYTNLLKLYAKHQLIDRAISLSRRLREEKLNLPGFYEVLGELIESQYKNSEPVVEQPAAPITTAAAVPVAPYYNPQYVPVPAPVGLHYLPPDASYQYMYPVQGFVPGYYMPAPAGVAGPPPPLPAAAAYPASMSPPYQPTTPDLSVTSETPTVVSLGGESFYSNQTDQGYLHRQLKRAVSNGDAAEGLGVYMSLERSGKVVNVTETSALIEQLVRNNMTHEATDITKTMLFRNTHPLPKIFRFLLNKLAISGCVEDINAIGQYLSTKIKKDVSYDNRLCNAYLSAGRGAEFLDILVADLEMAVRNQDEEMLAIIQDRFPRGGAMGLLDNHPELLDRFTVLAEQFAKTGYVAPMNVLWTYHFINNNQELSDPIWERYVRSSNQIMFQKICQVARSTGNLELAFGLVNKLAEADQVTPGARGIAYSCLLDCLCGTEQHKKGWKVLQDALSRGVQLEDVNRTALVRLKTGLESVGEKFPLSIPPKNNRREDRSLSPTNWADM